MSSDPPQADRIMEWILILKKIKIKKIESIPHPVNDFDKS